MKPFIAALLILAVASSAVAFNTWSPSNPRFPNNAYVAEFPASHWGASPPTPNRYPTSLYRGEAINGLLDWSSAGATPLRMTLGLTSTADPTNHNDGRSAWGWYNNTSTNVLAFASPSYQGSTMTESDVQFNNAHTWDLYWWAPWRNQRVNEFDVRTVARHEAGHALGLAHESTKFAVMAPFYNDADLPHSNVPQPGMLPHADDKNGLRTLYPASSITYRNLYTTCWRLDRARLGLPWRTLFYAPGGSIKVPCYLMNQSNVTIPGGATGVRAGIYLSTDDIFNTSDIRISEHTFGQNWAPYAEGQYEFTGTIPTTLVGTYHVGVVWDTRNSVAEAYKTDNGIQIAQVTIQNGSDLIVDSLNLSATTIVRGTAVTASGTVINNGSIATPATTLRVWMWQNPTTYSANLSFQVADIPVPALAPFTSFNYSTPVTIPANVAAERTWFVHATVDPDNTVFELSKQNNHAWVQTFIKWPTQPGYYLGQIQKTVSARSSAADYELYSKQVGTFSSGRTYFVLWTCSGTSPGVTLPPFGTLPLNLDVCTNIGITLATTVSQFHDMTGPQANTAIGSKGRVQGGTWLAPIIGLTTHFAAIYLDTGGNLVAFGKNAVSMPVVP